MKQVFALLLLSVPGFAAQKTLTGQITDSMCGADHSAMANGGKKADPHECTLVCVKGGAKFAFVSSGKVFDISNQSFADLAKHAGHTVSVEGDLGSDGKTLTVAKVAMKK